jgi:sugar phosphate isomerase/epimerase
VISRRELLATSLAASASAAAQSAPTKFQMACMTLPYSQFPLERALSGIRNSGYSHVAWGTSHRDGASPPKPVLEPDAPASEAAALARRCRDMGLEPVMMFATVQLEAPKALEVHLRRIAQAAAAGIPFLLTFGRTAPGEYDTFVSNLKSMAPEAKDAGVTILIKQHGGNTATGADCARVVRDAGHGSVKICYDAGNVLDYENHDPIPDIQTCWQDIRAFAIKDHRNTPKDEDCGPGFGEIDHYKLLMPVMRTGLTMPMAYENIFEPLRPRPRTPERIDALARRAREYIESVIAGLETHFSAKG